jgi:hypothetical protein
MQIILYMFVYSLLLFLFYDFLFCCLSTLIVFLLGCNLTFKNLDL